MGEELGTRERILREAAALFRRKGFNGASMQDLADAVGVTKSSLYHHFRSKQALLFEILSTTVDRETPALREIALSELPATERLHRAVARHVVGLIRDLDNVACFVEEGRYLAPRYRDAYIAKRDRYERYFRRILEDGIAAGEFRPIDVRLASLAILGMCNWVARWYRPDGAYGPEEIGRQFGELAVQGVAAGAPAPRTGAPPAAVRPGPEGPGGG
jgi:AcrR family transcriptional regulator